MSPKPSFPLQLYNNQTTNSTIHKGIKLSIKTYAEHMITGKKMTRLILRRLPLDALVHSYIRSICPIPV